MSTYASSPSPSPHPPARVRGFERALRTSGVADSRCTATGTGTSRVSRGYSGSATSSGSPRLALTMETQEQILQAMQKVYEDHHMSVVLVMKYLVDGGLEVGTGFIIKSTEKFALVMTCQHAIEQGKRIAIRLSGSTEEIVARVQHCDKESDLAILLVNMPSKYPELIFREKSRDVSVGELVFIVAYYNPDGLEALCLDSDVLPGRICGPLFASPSNTELTEVVHSCRSKPGCSGGPIIYGGKAI